MLGADMFDGRGEINHCYSMGVNEIRGHLIRGCNKNHTVLFNFLKPFTLSINNDNPLLLVLESWLHWQVKIIVGIITNVWAVHFQDYIINTQEA